MTSLGHNVLTYFDKQHKEDNIISQHQDDAGGQKLPCWRLDSIYSDGLAMQGARAAATMVFFIVIPDDSGFSSRRV